MKSVTRLFDWVLYKGIKYFLDKEEKNQVGLWIYWDLNHVCSKASRIEQGEMKDVNLKLSKL